MPTPCPFCGCPHVQVADASEELADECGYAVQCLGCGAFGPMGDTAAKAMQLWYTQPHVPTVRPDERRAIETALRCGKRYGYGNMIAHLKTDWITCLIAHGASEASAIRAADTTAMSYPTPQKGDHHD